jgi:hypothetical protein
MQVSNVMVLTHNLVLLLIIIIKRPAVLFEKKLLCFYVPSKLSKKIAVQKKG